MRAGDPPRPLRPASFGGRRRPLAYRATETTSRFHAEADGSVATRVALVIDPDPEHNRHLAELLEEAGWIVLAAGSSDEALSWADTLPLLDLIFCSAVALAPSPGEVAAEVADRWPTASLAFFRPGASAANPDLSGVTDVRFLAKPVAAADLRRFLSTVPLEPS